jgi:hypothetical protein
MARTTMAALISRMRSFVNDAAGTSQVWTDDQIQQYMDIRSLPVDFAPMTPIPTVGNGGTATYFIYRTPGLGFFETTDGGTAAFVVQDGRGSIQAASGYVMQYELGQLAFTTDRRGSAYFVTGTSYDVYGAAADILDATAARWATQFSFTADGASFNRAQGFDMLRKLADNYRRQAWPMVITNTRSDMTDMSGDDDGAVAYHRINV